MREEHIGRLCWIVFMGALLAPVDGAAQPSSPDHVPVKELTPEVHLPSGAEIDAADGKMPIPLRDRTRNVVTRGPSEARLEEALWLVRASSIDTIEALGRRLDAVDTLRRLTDAVDGAYVIRGSEHAVQQLFRWKESGWLSEYDWSLKLAEGLQEMVEASDPSSPLRPTTRIITESQVLTVDLGPSRAMREANVARFEERTLPLEIWLFADEEVADFVHRLAELVQQQPREEPDGSIRLGRVLVELPPNRPMESDDRSRVGTWLRLHHLPTVLVEPLARDPAVSRVLPLFGARGFQANMSARCQSKVRETNVSFKAVQDRPAPLWPELLALDGSGEIVGHADSGLDSGANVLGRNPDLSHSLLLVSRNGVLEPAASGHGRTGSNNWSDLTGHGTHTAGLLVASGEVSQGRFRGVAPGAKIVHHALASATGVLKVDPETMTRCLASAYRHGARIFSMSWGHPRGGYRAESHEIDSWLWNDGSPRDLLVVAAVGNGDERRAGAVASPADAKNVLAVGAVETDSPGVVAPFSVRGPGVGNRIKPDLVAPGTWLVSTRPYQQPDLIRADMEGQSCCLGWESWPRGAEPPWTQTTRSAQSGSASVTDSRYDHYPNNSERILVSPPFSSTATEISFWGRWQVAPEDEFVILFGDIDKWDAESSLRMPPTNPSWPDWDRIPLKIDEVLKLLRPEIRVGFLLWADQAGTADGIYVDDFRVSGWKSPCGLAETGLTKEGSPIDDHYTFDSGTSSATPLVAGLAARYRQFLRRDHAMNNPSAVLLKAALINGTTRPPQMRLPDPAMGFGVAGMDFVRRSGRILVDAIAGAGEHRYIQVPIDVISANEPLRATLVWFDPPAPSLVHDLDLILRSPLLGTYPQRADTANPVEDLYIAEPAEGRWTAEVRWPTGLPQSGVRFALVISGDVATDENPVSMPVAEGGRGAEADTQRPRSLQARPSSAGSKR